MGLSSVIDERLWAAVQITYEAGNYTSAILDAVYYLSELIRNKSGLDSDGNSLVGSAFGGPSPIVKVNPLYTESDRDEQRGVEQLLRGIYTAIRNPRSHEKRTDTSETADTLIAFIGWLASCIDKSKSPFDTSQILASVFDKHFAQNERYATLLVERIPRRKRLELLVEVFQQRDQGNAESISFFTQAALVSMPADEQAQYWRVVSEALECANEDREFRSALQIIGKDWVKVSEIARIRTEHRLIGSIREGEYDNATDTLKKGSLGTRVLDIAEEFILKNELTTAISGRVTSHKREARAYGFKYHFPLLVKLRPSPQPYMVRVLQERMKEQDLEVFNALKWVTSSYCTAEDQAWIDAFKDSIQKFVPPTEISDGDIPF